MTKKCFHVYNVYLYKKKTLKNRQKLCKSKGMEVKEE